MDVFATCEESLVIMVLLFATHFAAGDAPVFARVCKACTLINSAILQGRAHIYRYCLVYGSVTLQVDLCIHLGLKNFLGMS